ncbi:PQQ-binding-like beta-propeller repeat protein [Prosthecobacter sp.]|jgi:outer membrane protein assembly factor BamB|uniref:outer membrane protein assembly factor BamB family protein n=1 Tax=Prosthecobacter sp. TaxID=1965333 RepID=UPI003783E5E5
MKNPSRLFLLLFAFSACAAQEAFDRLTFHAAPKPLSKDAKASDWPRVLGPTDDAISPETHLSKKWAAGEPKAVWEVAMGEGYNSPAISGDYCVIFHALEGKETIECLHRETGKRFWSHEYPISYQDRYGFGNGPRGSPVIADGIVVTYGVTSELRALDLKTGKLLWKHDLRTEMHVPQDFFGAGGTPLILDGRVILNVGGKKGPIDDSEGLRDRKERLAEPGVSVAAFDLKSGDIVWKVEDAWGASYASPIPAKLHGQLKVLVYAGGESDPATGGLMCIDPASGKLHSKFAWRDDEYIQAIGTSPVVIPEKNRAFITTAYPKGRPLGGAMVEYDAEFQPKEVWQSKKLGVHWMNPVYHDGHLYAIDGETEPKSRLVCVNADTGAEVWEQKIEWDDAEFSKQTGRANPVRLSILRASLMKVDGAFLCLGEIGSLHWLDLSPAGAKVIAQAQPFYALNTWSLPALSHGLLYVRQQQKDLMQKTGERIICLDLRGE